MDRFDPPAAHSMDTSWFAVDADGFVARFESGEAGGVPSAAASGGGAGEPSFDVDALDAFLVARRWSAGTLPEPHGEPFAGGERLIVLLEPSPEPDGKSTYRDHAGATYPAEALLAPFQPVVIHDRDPRVALTRKPVPAAQANAIAKARGVLRVLGVDELYDLHEDAGSPIFAYANDDYDAPGRYARQAAPAEPVRVEELPAAIRGDVGALRVPVRFAEAAEIQLADFLREGEVQTWGEQPLRGTPEGEHDGEEAPPRKAPRPAPPPAAAPSTRSLAVLFAIAMVIVFLVRWILRWLG